MADELLIEVMSILQNHSSVDTQQILLDIHSQYYDKVSVARYDFIEHIPRLEINENHKKQWENFNNGVETLRTKARESESNESLVEFILKNSPQSWDECIEKQWQQTMSLVSFNSVFAYTMCQDKD